MDHLEGAANEDNEVSDDLYKYRALLGHQGLLKASDPNLKWSKYNVHFEWETGEKTYEPLSVLVADDPVTGATFVKENDLLHIDGCQRFGNLAKRDRHDLSSLASPKGEMKRSFSWTSLFKSPTSSTLCIGERTLGKLKQVKLLCSPTSITLCDPTLAKLNQETELCITKYIPLCDSVVHTGTNFSVPRSSSETNQVSNCNSKLHLQE